MTIHFPGTSIVNKKWRGEISIVVPPSVQWINDAVMQVFFRCELNTDPHIELWERWVLILICIHTFKGIAQMGRSSKFINCFLNVVTCLYINVRKSTSWISGKLCLQTWWTKLLLNIYWYDIQSAKKCIYWICTLKQ